MARWREERSLDLLAGIGLTLACGVIPLATGLFYLAMHKVPPLYPEFLLVLAAHAVWLLEVVLVGWCGVSVVSAYFQFRERHFVFSFLGTVVCAYGAFAAIGYPGGLLGVLAMFFVAISRDEFID